MLMYGYDVETTGLDAFSEEQTVIVECFAPEHPGVSTVQSGPHCLVGHNIWSFDALWLTDEQFKKVYMMNDTMAMAGLLRQPGESISLDAVALKYLNKQKIECDPVALGKEWADPDTSDIQRAAIELELATYCQEDAQLTYDLFDPLAKELRKQALWATYSMMRRNAMALVRTMRRGVRVHQYKLAQQIADKEQDRDMYKRMFVNSVGQGGDFNMNSHVQLAKLFYETLGLPVLGTTKSGAPATNALTIDKLVRKCGQSEDLQPLADTLKNLVAFRKADKTLGTFLYKMRDTDPASVVGYDNRIHTTYHMVYSGDHGARSGRLSSSNPNLQNIPSKDKRIKSLFIIPSADYRMFSADYSQIELRVAAAFSKCGPLLKVFTDGMDIHSSVAAILNNVEYDTFVGELAANPSGRRYLQRKAAKTIAFGILYGMGARSMSENLQSQGIDWGVGMCQNYIKKFFNSYPEIKVWKDDTVQQAKDTGEVRSLFGFPRRWEHVGYAEERQAANTPIQSTAAWITLKALSDMDAGDMCEPILTVHDEITAIYPRSTKGTAMAAYIEEVMVTKMMNYLEKEWNISIPLAVDKSVGLTNWGGV